MPDLSRSELAAYALCAVLVALLGWRALRHEPAAPPPSPGERTAPLSGGGVEVRRADGGFALVHVVGAVRRPGVYRLRAGARVLDAIRRAGGPGRKADLQGVNLAAKLSDAQQVVVPVRAPAAPAGAAPGAGASAAATGVGAAPAAPVDLNTATVEQLDTLDGVGPATAQKILDYRTQHGGFRSVDDLAQVPGIGPKKLAALRERVRV